MIYQLLHNYLKYISQIFTSCKRSNSIVKAMCVGWKERYGHNIFAVKKSRPRFGGTTETKDSVMGSPHFCADQEGSTYRAEVKKRLSGKQ